MTPRSKRPWLVLLPLGIVTLVVLGEVLPWMLREESKYGLPGAVRASGTWWLVPLSVGSAVVWLLVLWWALHHLIFQLASLGPTMQPSQAGGERMGAESVETSRVRFAVLYLTCDDFLPESCRTCMRQVYPPDDFKVWICDDSRTNDYRAEVDAFAAASSEVEVHRRSDRTGYKAGNLNHAFTHVARGQCDWVVIVDADGVLPSNYLAELKELILGQPPEVAFVQASRGPLSPLSPDSEGRVAAATPFQEALEIEVSVISERDMPCRERHGFFPFQGHGGAIRASAWECVQGFPLLVSEDYGFSMAARNHGLLGVRAEQVRSWEEHPADFGAFLVRLCKFAGGAAELLRRSFPRFLAGRASWIEKLDAGMLLATYPLMPLGLANLVASTYVCSYLWEQQLRPPLTPRLPYLFLGMLLLALPIGASVTRTGGQAVRHWFWALAIYEAALPLAALAFVLGLFTSPTFHRTPKRGQLSARHPVAGVVVCLGGVGAVALAWVWGSPFSLLLGAVGASCILFPVCRFLHEEATWRGLLSRTLVYVPGGLFVGGLVRMWLWATS
jgi:cellulose synthase/poly-beta-1,6-N-acetylglucosamine synthase-like glycosyltransferase